MGLSRSWVIWGTISISCGICGCQKYESAEISPVESLGQLENRKLLDDDVVACMAGESKDKLSSLGVEELAKAGLLLHPDLAVARAHLAAIEAGRKTAGESPNPTFSFSPEYSVNPGSASPWVVGWTLDFPIETAGKRELRIAKSDVLTRGARLELAESAWHVRGGIRDALGAFLMDQKLVELIEAESAARQQYVVLMESRLKAGEADRGLVNSAKIELQTVRQDWRNAQGQLAEDRVALAGAIGLSVKGLEGAKFAWEGIEQFMPIDPDGYKTLAHDELLNRLDLQRALLEYAGCEADLKLEIAKQYPDVHLGPGYQFDQGENKWSVGISFDLPIFNQNKGAIGEAMARRQEQAAKTLGVQAKALNELEIATTRYENALVSLKEADASLAVIVNQLELAKKALEVGEQDRLTVIGLDIQRQVAMRIRLEAVRKAREAAGAIENAIEKPWNPQSHQ